MIKDFFFLSFPYPSESSRHLLRIIVGRGERFASGLRQIRPSHIRHAFGRARQRLRQPFGRVQRGRRRFLLRPYPEILDLLRRRVALPTGEFDLKKIKRKNFNIEMNVNLKHKRNEIQLDIERYI